MTDSQFIHIFGQNANDPTVLQKCERLCTLFGLTPQDLFSNWEAYTYTELNNPKIKITPENLEGLQTYIQRRLTEQNKATTNQNSLKLNSKHSLQHPSLKQNSHDSLSNGSDSIKKRKLNASSSPVKEADASAMNTSLLESNHIIESLNADQVPNKLTTVPNKSIRIVGHFKKDRYKYRTMNLKLLDIADYLDEKIEIFTEVVAKAFNLEDSQFSDPTRQSQSEIYTVGRIVPDSPLSTSNDLNLHSLFLETSRISGFGIRVKLDLSDVKDYSFFPGQIVAFKGINSSGDTFKVLENMKLPYLGAPTHDYEDIEEFTNIVGDDNLKMIITSGPYHPKNSLDFSKLEKFITHINENVKPDVVIMTGPLIDVSAIPNILKESFFKAENSEDGDDLTDLRNLDDIFKSYLAPILNDIQCTRVIIVPHGNDFTNPHTSYPQAAFNRKEMGLSKKFKCFPNPSLFDINEVSMGVSTPDILRDLKDMPASDASTNRIERIVEHIIHQRHFYPIYPSPNLNFQVDTSFLGLAELDSTVPDVMILPSILKPFTKFIKNVLVLNPGSFIKTDGNGGTYLLMQTRSPDIADFDAVPKTENDDEEEVSEAYLTSLHKRARVDILAV